MLCPLSIGAGEWVCLVQVGEDFDGILLSTKVGKDPVEMFLHIERAHLNLISVESHQIRLHTECAGLVQTSATATGTKFAHIGDIHLAQRIQIEII